jgi:hypothetical protein
MEESLLAKPGIRILRDEATNMLSQALNMNFPRDDYKEMIELSLLVLGVELPNYNFKLPGANHRARWMARVIYSLKIYLFRKQFRLKPGIGKKIKEISLFFCLLYAKNWVSSTKPADAAFNDLKLREQLEM